MEAAILNNIPRQVNARAQSVPSLKAFLQPNLGCESYVPADRGMLVPDQSGGVRDSSQPCCFFDFFAVRLLLPLQGSLQVLLLLAWVLLPLAGVETLEVFGDFVCSELDRATQPTFFLRFDLLVMTESFRCHNFVSVASR